MPETNAPPTITCLSEHHCFVVVMLREAVSTGMPDDVAELDVAALRDTPPDPDLQRRIAALAIAEERDYPNVETCPTRNLCARVVGIEGVRQG